MHALADLLVGLRFFSRLPVPRTRRELDLGARGVAAAAAMVPFAGAIIGLVPAAVLIGALALNVSSLPAAALAIAALVLVTGALHEDALADCADGFGGGATRDRKLEIMRDSRIGTFGACAIALSLLTRASALSAVAARQPWLGAAALIATASLSRTACLLPLRLLPPARADGLGAAAGRPSDPALALATVFAVGVSAALLSPSVGVAPVVAAVGLAATGALLTSALALRQIGGQTGDVVGAAEQVAECLVLCVLAAEP